LKIRTPLRSSRRGRRGRARVTDYRTPPGGNPLYASRLAAAEADAEQAKNGPLTRAERDQIEKDLRAGIDPAAGRSPGDERSVTDAIAAVPDPDWSRVPVPAAQVEAQRAASAPQPALRGFPGGALPAEDVPQSWPRGQHPYPQVPQPSFTAREPSPRAETAPIPLPVTRRPYVPRDALDHAAAVTGTVRPVIGDSMPALPPEPEPPAPPAPGTSTALYAGPGWTERLASMRVRNGEWDELPAIVERGLGRNAADEAAGFRHSRAVIGEGVRQQCAAIGRSDLAAPLLYRVHELVTAARAAQAEEGAA